MIYLSNPQFDNNYVFIVPKVFSTEDLKWLESYFANKKLHSAEIYSDDSSKNESIRKTDITWFDATEETAPIYQKLAGLIKYVNESHYHWNLTFLETVQYGEYGPGGHYNLHCDTGLHNQEGHNRKLSFSILLSEDFEGGALEIPGVYPEIFNPKKNEAIFFPSSMPHRVAPIKEGVRKSMVGWVHGPNFV